MLEVCTVFLQGGQRDLQEFPKSACVYFPWQSFFFSDGFFDTVADLQVLRSVGCGDDMGIIRCNGEMK